MKKLFLALLFLIFVPISTAHASVDKVEKIEKLNLNVPTYTISEHENFPQGSLTAEGKLRLTGGFDEEPYRGLFFLEKRTEKHLYNVDESGYLKPNSKIIDLDNNQVFFNDWGISYSGVHEIEGKKYLFINGVIQKGWTNATNIWYSKEADKKDHWSYSDLTTGELQMGLVNIDGEYVLFSDASGPMFEDSYGGFYTETLCQDQFVYTDEKTYYADSEGHPVKGIKKLVRSIYNSERLFYFNENGVMQQEKLIKFGDDYYYFEFWGGAVTNTIGFVFDGKIYGFDSEGKNYKNTWVGEYYFTEDGIGADGFIIIDGFRYHFGYYHYQYSRGLIKILNPETQELEDYLFEKNGHAYAGIHNHTSYNPNPENKYYYTDEWGKIIKLSSGWHKIDNRFIYFKNDGTVYKLHGLQTISGSKYFIDEDGVIQTGLQTISENKYFFGVDGKMQTGWQSISGKPYYFGTDGIMKTGWQTISGKKYYFGTDGKMRTSWQAISGKKYYFGTDGKMRTSWQTISGKKYYFGTDGKMRTSWQTVSGKKYYFGTDGKMRTSWQTVSGKKYYFGTDGKMRTSWQAISGKKYYFGTDGKMRTSWQTVSGKKYYFGTDGKMRTSWQAISGKKYYFGTDGKMRTSWQTVSGKKYYFGTDGKMRTSWQTVSGKKYYFGTDGKMRTGKVLIGKSYYLFDKNGVYIKKL